jgi:hypothetical protein
MFFRCRGKGGKAKNYGTQSNQLLHTFCFNIIDGKMKLGKKTSKETNGFRY